MLKRMVLRDASSASTPVARASSMSIVSLARGGGLARPVLARSGRTLGVSGGTSSVIPEVVDNNKKKKRAKTIGE